MRGWIYNKTQRNPQLLLYNLSSYPAPHPLHQLPHNGKTQPCSAFGAGRLLW